jgi:hypothetical protein
MSATCKATFTVAHNDTPFMDRIEVFEMTYELGDNQNMIEGLIAYLTPAKEEEKPSTIIT